MDSRAKEMGYSESIGVYPDVNDFQYMHRSPPASIRAFKNRDENSASATLQAKQPEVGVWDEPLASTQQQLSPPRPRHTFFGVLGSWVWELLSCVIALGALAGILVVLQQFNGRALRDWPYSITINTLLSILITVIKAAVVVPLAEGISQLKWSWYKRRDQTLKDIVTFDEASRGAFGASKLVLSRSPFHLTTVASILFFASFAIGPFAQQVVQISQRDLRDDQTASIPVCAGRYNDINPGPSSGYAPGLLDVGLSTIGAIYDGILQNSSNTPIKTTCPSGNCTFNSYQSLGFCSRCADITDELVPHHPTTGKVIPIGDCPEEGGCVYVLRSEERTNLVSWLQNQTVVNTTAASQELRHPDLANIPGLVNFTGIYGETGSRRSNIANVAAFECSLYFCVQQYNGVVKAGNFSEVLNEIPSKLESEGSFLWDEANVTITPDVCYKDGVAKYPPYNDDDDDCTYSLYGANGRALYQAINPLLTGIATYSAGRTFWSTHMMKRIGEETGNKIDTIDSVFKSLARRLTNHVRTVPNICGSTVSGTVWVTEAFISVRWLWLILPAAVVAATFLLLLVIIIRTWNEYIWKSSPLALVFLGMQDNRQSDGVTHPIFPRSPEIGSMMDSSNDIKINLDRSGRWTIVGNR